MYGPERAIGSTYVFVDKSNHTIQLSMDGYQNSYIRLITTKLTYSYIQYTYINQSITTPPQKKHEPYFFL